MYDVIVVGAGPAGCVAAKRLAEAGCRVLLVEKKQLPREKSCSGVLIQRSISFLEREFGPIPSEVLCRPNVTGGLILVVENGKFYRFPSHGLNVWRSNFDFWLAKTAQEHGVELLQRATVLSYREDDHGVAVRIRSNGAVSEEKAVAAVICDGAAGWAQRSASSAILTLQTFHHGHIALEHDFFHAFLEPQFSGHDAWVNVKDDFIIVGISGRDEASLPGFHARFVSFLNSRYNAKLSSSCKRERWLMPSVTPGAPLLVGEGRLLFAGEAAGFLNPMGEGISAALISGAKAAETILTVLDNDAPEGERTQRLSLEYTQNLASELEYMARQWGLLGRLSPEFSKFII
jgi:flavin-dependent dehydrogenase